MAIVHAQNAVSLSMRSPIQAVIAQPTVNSNATEVVTPAKMASRTRGMSRLAPRVAWDTAMREFGDLMEPTDHWPPRYRVKNFPSVERIRALDIA
jgi:hypothetical protein